MEPIVQHPIFLSFYGDDFTGSTDVMESLHLFGINTALFLSAPTPGEIASFVLKTNEEPLQAYGVAGISRSLTPEQMDKELPPIFEQMSQISTDFFHYKICSTFDSAPHIGNIGHATSIALQYFPSTHIPLVVGAPSLNRFCVFGNLFAQVDQTTYRLDRHPTMAKHPVTPMRESDLAKHLSLQTDRPLQSMNVLALESADAETHYESLLANSESYILFDTLNEQHLHQTGKLILEHADYPQLLIGSSGTEYALNAYLQNMGKVQPLEVLPDVSEAVQMIVMAGSAAPMTKKQIEHSIDLGFEDIRMITLDLVNPAMRTQEIERLLIRSRKALSRGRSIIVYSALGPDDPSIQETQAYLQSQKVPLTTSALLAGAQGDLLKLLLAEFDIRRVAVAGGDTSGEVARALGIYALETLIPIAPGAPLCLAHSEYPRFDGLEIALKGGQNGNPRFFESILTAKILT